MYPTDEDLLDLNVSPEVSRASELLAQAGETLAEDALPLKKLEATCALRCFESVRDIWNMSSSTKRFVSECVEKCEEPMERVGEVLERERDSMLEATATCLERCPENDEACANRCISTTLSADRMESMISRVRSTIVGYKYS